MRCWTVTIILDLWLLSSFEIWINWTREQIPKFTGSTNKWSIPEVFLVNTFGNDRIPVSWLRRRLFMDGDNIDIKLLKHSGAMPCNNLKRMSFFLYSLRYHTGSRYNSRSRGVLYCNYNNKPQLTRRVQAFMTHHRSIHRSHSYLDFHLRFSKRQSLPPTTPWIPNKKRALSLKSLLVFFVVLVLVHEFLVKLAQPFVHRGNFFFRG